MRITAGVFGSTLCQDTALLSNAVVHTDSESISGFDDVMARANQAC